jgi:hypothetical protein
MLIVIASRISKHMITYEAVKRVFYSKELTEKLDGTFDPSFIELPLIGSSSLSKIITILHPHVTSTYRNNEPENRIKAMYSQIHKGHTLNVLDLTFEYFNF